MRRLIVGTTATERCGIVVWHLAHGEGLTMGQVVAMTGLTPSAAYRMLNRLSRVVPIYQNDEHSWEVCAALEQSQ